MSFECFKYIVFKIHLRRGGGNMIRVIPFLIGDLIHFGMTVLGRIIKMEELNQCLHISSCKLNWYQPIILQKRTSHPLNFIFDFYLSVSKRNNNSFARLLSCPKHGFIQSDGAFQQSSVSTSETSMLGLLVPLLPAGQAHPPAPHWLAFY